MNLDDCIRDIGNMTIVFLDSNHNPMPNILVFICGEKSSSSREKWDGFLIPDGRYCTDEDGNLKLYRVVNQVVRIFFQNEKFQEYHLRIGSNIIKVPQ